MTCKSGGSHALVMLGHLAYSQLTQHNPTDFATPHRLSLFATLTAPRNPNLTFYNGFKILRSAFPPHSPKIYNVYLWGIPYSQVLYLWCVPYLQITSSKNFTFDSHLYFTAIVLCKGFNYDCIQFGLFDEFSKGAFPNQKPAKLGTLSQHFGWFREVLKSKQWLGHPDSEPDPPPPCWDNVPSLAGFWFGNAT